MKALNKWNVSLNWNKCIIGVAELDFLGHHLSEKGINPTESKLAAVRKFREPNTVEEVRSFLGLITFLGCYIPDLATVTDPLRQLLKKDNKFDWGLAQQKAFGQLKENLASGRILGYFDVRERTQIYADASPVGLGAIMIQLGREGPRVITCASKSLTATERRYCQTEKEALGLVWAVEKFHPNLYGIEFDLITDHQALLVIFGPRSKPCARIERWVLRLQSFKYKIIYKAGKSNIADVFSRLCQEGEKPIPFDEEAEIYVSTIMELARPVALKLVDIQEKSRMDEEILAVSEALNTGTWKESILAYKNIHEELCFVGEVLLRGTRIVVPKELRLQTIQLAHEGHPGITGTKNRLRLKVWWPKMDANAEEFVRKCRSCLIVSAPPRPEPLRMTEMPDKPWKHLAIDFMGPLPSGDNLLVTVDYFSRFVEIDIMRSIEASEVIKRLKAIFARFGVPQSITMDNGSSLTAEEFKQFCREYNIHHVYTIPYWPQQNGEVERQNRSILKRLQISQASQRDWKQDLTDYLFMYRTTPQASTGKTPAELMFGRQIKDKFPEIDQPLEENPNYEEARENDAIRKKRAKIYADNRRGAKANEVEIGDKVVAKNMVKANKLTPTFGTTEFEVIGRSGSELRIKDDDGCIYRRNVAHTKQIPPIIGEPHSDPKELKKKAESKSKPEPTTDTVNDRRCLLKRKAGRPARYQ